MDLQKRFPLISKILKPALWDRSLALSIAAVLAFCTSCSTSHYRKSADREVYQIVEQAEQEVFGKSTSFTITTPYSDRKPAEVRAEEIIKRRQEANARKLTIEEALALAVKNSREYQTAKEQLYLEALALTGARHDFRPLFSAGGSATYRRENGEWDLRSARSTVEVGQLLKSGGSLTLRLVNDFLRFYTGDPSRSAVSAFSVNLVQPLLRGAGKTVAAERLTQAERNVIYAVRTFSQYQRQFKVDVVTAYFRILQNGDQLVNAYNDYQRRLETIQYTEERGKAGLQSQLDVDEARSEELTAKNSYIQAATTYLNNLDRFKLTLGLPLSVNLELDESPLNELRKVGLIALSVDKERALRIAIDHQLELLNQIDSFEDSERLVRVAANQLKADLTLQADASISPVAPLDYTKFSTDDIQAGVGLGLDLPIDRLNERNSYRRSLINFEKAVRSLGLAIDNKKDQIDSGLRDLEQLRRSYFIQTNAVAIAERRVEGEQLSLQAGRRTVRNVRDAQDSLVRSQDALTAALVNHLTARLQLLLDVGVMNADVDHFWDRREAITMSLAPEKPAAETAPETEQVPPPNSILKL